MVECRSKILESLPYPQGEKESEIFTRAISALIPRLLPTPREPERISTSKFFSVYYVDDVASGKEVNSSNQGKNRVAMYHETAGKGLP